MKERAKKRVRHGRANVLWGLTEPEHLDSSGRAR